MNRQSDIGCAEPDNLGLARLSVDTATSIWRVPAAVCLSGVAFQLAFAGPAVATLAIRAHLADGMEASNWIVNASVRRFGSCLMFEGTLTDRYGRKQLYALGVGGYALASLAMTVAASVTWLDLLRAVKGTTALAQECERHERMHCQLAGHDFRRRAAFGTVLADVSVEPFAAVPSAVQGASL